MSDVRALVLRAAGINCDEETVRALAGAGAEVELVHLNALARDPGRLARDHVVVVPGGFSYGDDVAAGRVLGVEIAQRIGRDLAEFVAGGGYLVGICNGFQALVELGVFEPDRAPHERGIALTDNASSRFEARWVVLRAERSRATWLEPGALLPCPVAHAEGRLVVRASADLERLEQGGQIALRYVDADRPGEPAGYPANPNGAVSDVAGLCDPTGRVLGLMPHPERNLDPWNHPRWTRLPARDEGEGASFFRALVQAAAAGRALSGARA